MDKLLKGIMQYRELFRPSMVEQIKRRTQCPPAAVFFACMDSRMLPAQITSSDAGDMLIVRNAGNLVPHSRQYGKDSVTTEPGAIELGCIHGGVRNILVCGHSDCKAMNMLYKRGASERDLKVSPLMSWVFKHGAASLQKFEQFEANAFTGPLTFRAEIPIRTFVAYVDPDDMFKPADKLSQVNCLQQIENISSYQFIKSRLENGELFVHALWIDLETGNIYYFSRQQKQFIIIDEATIDDLGEECRTYYGDKTVTSGSDLVEDAARKKKVTYEVIQREY